MVLGLPDVCSLPSRTAGSHLLIREDGFLCPANPVNLPLGVRAIDVFEVFGAQPKSGQKEGKIKKRLLEPQLYVYSVPLGPGGWGGVDFIYLGVLSSPSYKHFTLRCISASTNDPVSQAQRKN